MDKELLVSVGCVGGILLGLALVIVTASFLQWVGQHITFTLVWTP